MNIIFFGTPDFAAGVLQFLLDNNITIKAVITKPDRPKGRSGKPQPTPVKLIANAVNPPIPVFQPELVSAPDFASTLKQFQPDLFVVVAYGEIIKQHLLDMPSLGCINVHPSLLPRYRGATPIQASIIHGDTVTGVTIMHMVRKMDAGNIIKKVEVSIEQDASFPEIEKKLCEAGSKALLEVIQQFSAGGMIAGEPQNEELVSYSTKIELEDCQIDWKKPAKQLHNLIRAVTPDPGAWCYADVRGERKRLRILSSRVVEEQSDEPGQIVKYGKGDFIIGCGLGSLKILEVQLEGKKVMSATDFICGLPRQFISLSN